MTRVSLTRLIAVALLASTAGVPAADLPTAPPANRAAGPLMVLFIDEHKLDAMVRWEAASPVPPTGVAPDTLFPHVYGTINRDAVEGMMEVQRNTDGHAAGLAVWP